MTEPLKRGWVNWWRVRASEDDNGQMAPHGRFHREGDPLIDVVLKADHDHIVGEMKAECTELSIKVDDLFRSLCRTETERDVLASKCDSLQAKVEWVKEWPRFNGTNNYGDPINNLIEGDALDLVLKRDLTTTTTKALLEAIARYKTGFVSWETVKGAVATALTPTAAPTFKCRNCWPKECDCDGQPPPHPMPAAPSPEAVVLGKVIEILRQDYEHNDGRTATGVLIDFIDRELETAKRQGPER